MHLSLTFDEETTFLGVRGLVADLQERGVKPAGCIIGEPTDMQAIVAHKGKRDFCCRVRGREAHSSLTPTAVNSIEYAAQVIGFIRALAARMAREEPKDGRFEVPHSTLQTGVIRGGIAVNVVPRDCEFFFEMRNVPATPHEAMTQPILEFARALLPEMRAVAPEAGIAFEMGMDLPAFGTAPDAPVVWWAGAASMWTLYRESPLPLWRPAVTGGPALRFTTRRGGVSAAPYDPLNIGRATSDDPAAVAENRRRVLAACGHAPARLATAGQVHGARLVEVDSPGHVEACDGLLTRVPGLPLAITVADCMPLILVATGALAVAHAGWRGTAAGMPRHALLELCRAAEVPPEAVVGHLGPCIRACCYAVHPVFLQMWFGMHFLRWGNL